MESRIELERRGRPPAEVKELNLDNSRAKAISGLTDEYTSLETLSMINVGLTSLEGLPALPALKNLNLSENKIAGGFDKLQACPSLATLNLAGNKIKDILTIKPLNGLKNLVSLDLFGCEVANADDYRAQIFKTLPSLKYLDGYDVNDVAQESDDDDEGDVGDEYAEGGDSDEEEIGDEDEEAEELGLAYLDSSKALQDEDETEDFAPDEEDSKEGSEGGERGEKRKRADDEDEEDEDEN